MAGYELIECIETFLRDNKCNDTLPCLNNYQIEDAIKTYDDIIKAPTNTYEIFGTAGFTTYSLYKSMDSKIYMFSVYIQELKSYTEITEDIRNMFPTPDENV